MVLLVQQHQQQLQLHPKKGQLQHSQDAKLTSFVLHIWLVKLLFDSSNLEKKKILK